MTQDVPSKASKNLHKWIQEVLSDKDDSDSDSLIILTGLEVKDPQISRRRNFASKNIERWKRRLSKEPLLLQSLMEDYRPIAFKFKDLQISARRRNFASKKIEKQNRKPSKDEQLLQSTVADHMFDGDIFHACKEFGLDASNVKHRILLLGIFCESYFPGFGNSKKRGRPGIHDRSLRGHAQTLDQIIKRHGIRAVMIEACDTPRDVILRQKISDERRAVLLQKFWPEYYEAYSVEVIGRHLRRIKTQTKFVARI